MISIFAKPPFLMRHLQRVSSTVRGEQIAAYLGNARLNPPSGYENDTCIYVKPHITPIQDFKFEKKSWMDIHEAFDLIHILNKYPEVGVITLSDWDAKFLTDYIKNKIVLIPHHHCNFERVQHKQREKIKKVGITGSPGAFQHIPTVIREGLAKRKIALVEYSTFYPRTAVTRFHADIDVHLQWRPYQRRLSTPFKIINAASFGVPTIALNEPSFYEMEGCYIPIKTPEDFLIQLDNLIVSPKLYSDMAKVCIEKSEKYHIENISKLYTELDK